MCVCVWQRRWLAHSVSGSVTAPSASRYAGAVTAALTALITQTRSAVHPATSHPMTSAMPTESFDVLRPASAFISRGSVTRTLTVKMGQTKQTVSEASQHLSTCTQYASKPQHEISSKFWTRTTQIWKIKPLKISTCAHFQSETRKSV